MSVLSTLPALAATALFIVTVALGSEPPISNPQPENGMVANLLHDSRKGPETLMAEPTVQASFNVFVPRFTADLEGDLSPVLFVSNLEHDFPAFELAPEPDHIPDTGQMVAQVVAEPVRTPLPAISSVPHECPVQIVEYFSANPGAACAVSWCESGWRLDAWNFNPATRDDSHGPFQINFYGTLGPDRLALVQSLGYPVTTQEEAKALLRSDWQASLRVASVLSAGGVNWSAWSCRPW